MAWHYPLAFDPHGALLHMCSVSLVPKEGERRCLYPLLKQSLPFFVLAMAMTLIMAMTITLRMFTRDKLWLFIMFLCDFHFGERTGG